MVGDHHENGAGILDPCQGAAHQFVHARVHRGNDLGKACQLFALVGRVGWVEGAEEHVLDSVRAVEDAGGQAFAGFFKGVEEHGFAFAVQLVGLVKKGLFIDDAGVQGVGVIGQSQGGKGSQASGQVGGVGSGTGKRQSGMSRVDLNGGDIELKRLASEQVEATQTAQANTRCGAKKSSTQGV